MNYDFLQNYSIPIVQRNTDNQFDNSSYSNMEGTYGAYSIESDENPKRVNTAYYGYEACNAYGCSYQSAATTAESSFDYQEPDRFIAPSKQGTGYVPHKTHFKRKHIGVGGGSAPKKETPTEEVTNDGKLVMFLGRDESYPDELNLQIHPLSCDLCNVKMNSRVIAKDHYESKAHDKHISSWLFKNFTEKGINPPTVKRFIKQGQTGPDAYYCEPCDLKLTSLTHANQHYAGKKHRLVIAQRAKPSGAGFYNSEGKWVRTGTKVTPNSVKGPYFGIGEAFRCREIVVSTNMNNIGNPAKASTDTIRTSIADTTTTAECEVKLTKKALPTNSDQDLALFCSICKISVTSAVQMTMHLCGSKHMKKLIASCNNPTPICSNNGSEKNIIPAATVIDNVLLSAIKEEIKPDPTDLSVYRTPSGQYYCKTCNTSMSHLPALEQHLKGKRHLRKLTEEKALASLAVKKN